MRSFMLRIWFAMLIITPSCFAQSESQTASITGILKDISGAVVPKANIALKAGNGQVLQTITDNAGDFTIESTPGVYTLTASSQGFKVFTEVVPDGKRTCRRTSCPSIRLLHQLRKRNRMRPL